MSVYEHVLDRYSEGAQDVQPELCCPVDYDKELLKLLPNEFIEKDYGCGDPSSYVKEGDVVLDLGSGGGKICYMAAQLVIGMWEWHVNDLDPEFIADMHEYKPYLNKTMWAQPQLRTIPVGQSIDNSLEVMTYERAEKLIADHDRFAIAPCICRREKKMIGEGCDRPEAYCLTL